MEYKIASLTTLCTPHKGSPVASKIMKLPKFILKFVAFWVNFWYRIFGDKHPDSYNVCKELQIHENDELVSFSDKVYCQSYSTTISKIKDDFIMGIPLMLSRCSQNEETDGLVPVNSAIFENYRGNCIPEPISHSQIVDFMVSKRRRKKYTLFILQFVKSWQQ